MKMFRSLPILLLLSLIYLTSCEKTDIFPGSNDSETPSASSVNKSLLLQLVNDVRTRGCNCGSTYMPPVGTVTWNNQLEAAALAHATDMYQKNYFSHTGQDGSSPGDRIRRAGYQWRTYGENLAKGYTSEQAVINGWIQSEGHCKNLMNGAFREMGVARVGSYWAQEFGAR